MAQVTQSDIAKQLGLSQRAVGYALSNDIACRRKLNSETRELILQTAHRLGYVPHHAARRLARARSSSRACGFEQIGIIYLVGPNDDGLDPVFLAMMGGAEGELYKLHAFVTFVRVHQPADWEKVDMLVRAGSLDGWLVYGNQVDDAAIKRLRLPCVILGDHRCRGPICGTNIDNRAVGRMAVERLAALGHRQLGLIGSPPAFAYQEETRAGFRAAARQLGIQIQEPAISWSYANSQPIADWYRSVRPQPTAVFTPEFEWVDPVHRALSQAGFRVPQQISLLGCEADSGAAKSSGFTRLELPMRDLGRQGAALLHRAATQPGLEPTAIKISPVLLEGWSTCPPRAGAADGSTAETGIPAPAP